MNFHKLTFEQARRFSDYIRPGVLDEPGAKQYWYLSASEKGSGMLGMAVVNPKKPEPELLSIGVAQKETRQGIGSELLDFTLMLLRKAGAEILRVVYACGEREWEGLDRFLQNNGFLQMEEEAYSYRATLAEILSQKLLCTQEEMDQRIMSVESLAGRRLRSFRGEIARTGQFDPVVFDECAPEYSFAWVEEDTIKALFLIGVTADGELHNLWTWISPATSDLRRLQRLFAYAAQKAARDYPPDTVVHFPCLTAASDRLLRYLIPGAKRADIMRVYVCPTAEAAGGDAGAETDGQTGESGNVRESTFAERQADASLSQISNEEMCCARCEHCRKGDVGSCARYIRKPGAVFYGGDCPQFKADGDWPEKGTMQ